jgi:hypothetical protein
MTKTERWFKLAVLQAVLLAGAAWGQAGPPFQTDDPTPVDHGHYEAYVFGTLDGTPAELDTISPGFEVFNGQGFEGSIYGDDSARVLDDGPRNGVRRAVPAGVFGCAG